MGSLEKIWIGWKGGKWKQKRGKERTLSSSWPLLVNEFCVIQVNFLVIRKEFGMKGLKKRNQGFHPQQKGERRM